MSLTLTRRHNVDRFGYLIPTKYGNVPMTESVATYRPGEGRFGRGAVAVEEGTANLVITPDYSTIHQHPYHDAEQFDCPESPTGKGLRAIVSKSVGSSFRIGTLVEPAENATFSVYMRGIGGTVGGRVRIYCGGGSNTAYLNSTGKNKYLTSEFQRFEFSGITTSGEARVHVPVSLEPGWGYEIHSPQLEAKPFATSFVDGTRPDGILAYPIALPENHTIACYRKSHTDEDYKHVVKRSDGKVFVDGVEDSEYDVGWIAGRNLVLDSATEHTFTNTIFRKPLRADVFHKLIGEQLTLSFYAKAEFAGQMMDCYLRDDLAQVGISGSKWGPFEVSTEYTRYTYTIVLEDISDINRLSFAFRNTSGAGGSVRGAVSVKNIKIEKGSIATDWTPAPEDLDYSDDCLMFSNQTGLIDELLILPYAATEEEIRGWYEAQGPLPPHPQALLQWDWQAVRPAQIVKL